MQKRHVVAAADDAYIQHFVVMLASFLDFNRAADFVFHLLSTQLSPRAEGRLRDFVDATEIDLRVIDVRERVGMLEGLPVNRYVTLATYFRLLIPFVVGADIETILYLDVDLLVLGQVLPLFQLNLENYGVAAVPNEIEGCFAEHGLARSSDYFNAGVLVINLKYWRAHAVSTGALTYGRQNPALLHYWDQCALNAVLRDRVYHLGSRWNVQGARATEGLATILHFTGPLKPWLYVSEAPGKQLYWKYLRRTPWSDYVPPDRTPGNRIKRILPAVARRAIRKALARGKTLAGPLGASVRRIGRS